MRPAAIAILFLMLSGLSGAQTPALEQRLFVLLSPTDMERPPVAEMQTLQAAHLANIRSMAEDGLLLLAGPTRPVDVADRPVAGILAFASADPDLVTSVTARLARDPLIAGGYLRADQYVLFFETGDNLYERRPREQ
jgi:uncharacterized protein YciI